MRVRRHRILSSHAVCTRVSDTTLSSAAENHTEGESGTRDPLVLAPRSLVSAWQLYVPRPKGREGLLRGSVTVAVIPLR